MRGLASKDMLDLTFTSVHNRRDHLNLGFVKSQDERFYGREIVKKQGKVQKPARPTEYRNMSNIPQPAFQFQYLCCTAVYCYTAGFDRFRNVTHDDGF